MIKLLAKSIIVLFLSFFAFTAQSQINEEALIQIDQFSITNSASNNVSLVIKFEANNQRISDSINQSRVNSKQGFNAQYSNNLLSLNFTQKFTKAEINILLAYCGIQLESGELSRLQKLLN